MHNPHRGEIAATLNGRPHKLCLTLGALAELETAFGNEDMLALADRFSTGRITARDAARVISCGLRGGGHDISDDAVLDMQADNGAAGYIDIVARLLAATFGQSPAAAPPASTPQLAPHPQPQHHRPGDLRNPNADRPQHSPLPMPALAASPHHQPPLMARAEIDAPTPRDAPGAQNPFHGPR